MKLLQYLTVAIAVLFFSCEEENTQDANIRINHYKQVAVGLGPTLVLLTQEDQMIGTEEWQYHYSGITGFDYEWGFTYDLLISKKTIIDPPQDGSSIEFILEEVISKTPVLKTDTFEIKLKSVNGISSSVITGDLEAGFELLYEQEIDCNTLCDEMMSSIKTEDELTGVFTHNEGKIRLEQLILK
ncbi:MAG: DUF4377 domain-containing protein [Reichenbachiella sp.]